jgi:hypothetical protein
VRKKFKLGPSAKAEIGATVGGTAAAGATGFTSSALTK